MLRDSRQKGVVCAAFLALFLLAGCGGGGGGAPRAPESGDQAVDTAGRIIVETAASSAYHSLALGGASSGDKTFVGLYGAWFTRVEYKPAPGWLCGCATTYSALATSHEDGTGLHYPFVASWGTTSPTVEWPRWSPNGRQIAFAPAGESLMVCDADGSDAHVISTGWGTGGIRGLCWAPSGYIYYAAKDENGREDIYLVHPENPGASDYKFTDDDDQDEAPDVSPSGTWIVWSRRTDKYDDWDIVMARTAAAGSPSIQKVTFWSSHECKPRWSNSGRFIAFVRYGTNGSADGVYVYDTASRVAIQVSDKNAACCDWSSDDQYVLFLSGTDLYRVRYNGSPGDEELVRANWGRYYVDCYGHGIRRVVVGPPGSDWGGRDPRLGERRAAVIVVMSDKELVSAASFVTGSQDQVVLYDRTPANSTNLVVCEARTRVIYKVIEDNGPREPLNEWRLTVDNTRPGAVLVVFDARTGKISSVVGVWEEVSSSAVRGPRVALEGGRLVITGGAMRVYDAHGNLVSGATPVSRAAFDAATGVPLVDD